MLGTQKYGLCLVLLMMCCGVVLSQEDLDESLPPDTAQRVPADAMFLIGDIVISGNKKTKAPVILREIPFKTGEHYPLSTLVKKFEDARRQLMNTTLFHSVIVAARDFDGNRVNVTVHVRERWYLFPFPYFKPVDRNLNQWLVEQKASLSRVNYGAKLLYNNPTGYNDKLRLYLIGGYTKQISLSYDRLYFDRNMKWGGTISFNTGKNREINYNTMNDKQVFLKDNNSYLRNFLNITGELSYRRAIKTRHSFGIGYYRERVSDTVVALNGDYFKEGKNSIAFPEIFYKMTYYDLDYIPYPTKGYAAFVSVSKKGFNQTVNVWQIDAKGLASWKLSPKTFLNLNVYGGLKLPFDQPYFNRRFLGYSDVFLQGFEYFVVDGVAGGYTKATLAREILNFKIRIPPVKKGKDPEYIPFRVFAKMYGNAGYVHSPSPGENQLNNQMLWSGGFGIDILTLYDVTFKLEWSFNHLGQNGLFLHRKSIF